MEFETVTDFRVDYPFEQTSSPIDFPMFVDIVKGTTIISVADWGHFVELGFSEDLMLRISNQGSASISISIVSTSNSIESTPSRVDLDDEMGPIEASLLESRIRAVRQVYAIFLMILDGRGDELGLALHDNSKVDVEAKFLSKDEWLSIEAAGPGSFWLSVLSTAKGAPQLSANMLSLVFSEGRRHLLERVMAGTEIKRQAAARAHDDRFLELSKALNEVTDPSARAAIEHSLAKAVYESNPSKADFRIIGPASTAPKTPGR